MGYHSMAADTAQALLRQMGHVYGELVEHTQARLQDIVATRKSVD